MISASRGEGSADARSTSMVTRPAGISVHASAGTDVPFMRTSLIVPANGMYAGRCES